MPLILPRHAICVLGNWRNLDQLEAIIREDDFAGFKLDREFSQLSHDDRMLTAFQASYDRVSPSMSDVDWNAVRTHKAVAYILSPPINKADALEVSGRALSLIGVLLQQGGIAAKSESAGIAHGRDHWLELAAKFAQAVLQGDEFNAGASLFEAWVRRPMIDKHEVVYYSCGMHLLGEPDVEISTELEMSDAIRWIDLLGLYLTGDRPPRPLKNGEGFSLADNGHRRIISIGPCNRYEEDDFFFNPYGYIRLEPEEVP